MRRIFSILIALWGCLLATGADTKITVLSDIHVMAPELIVNDGKAWQDFLAAKRTMLDYSTQLFDEQVERLVAERPDIVLITGDLTKDGETASHRLVVSQLDRLRTAGIKVLVIPGDHDLGMPSALIYDGDKTSKAETANSNQFAELYNMYGYGADSERDPNSLSYCAEPVSGLVIVGIACDDHGRLGSSTLSWVCQRVEKARAEGKQVLAMMHFLLFPHIANIEKKNDNVVEGYETVRDKLIEAGIKVVLTGHFHILEMAKDYHTDMSAEVYEIVTPSTAAYPCAYRQLTLNSDMTQLKVDTKYITSLKGVSDFQSMAKDRLVDGTTRLFMKEEADNETAANLAAKGFVVHAAGGEDESGESKTYLAFYEVTSFLLKLTGVLDDKLSEAGMTWDMVDDTVRSMLKDISGYGKGKRENRTDDFSLTIDLPKTTPSGITSVEADSEQGTYYNLQGIRVTAPSTKGLYIQNGRLKPVR